MTGQVECKRGVKWSAISHKAQVIQECREPDATIAGVALNHGLNANLVHKWIRVQEQRDVGQMPAFIPLKLPALPTQP